MITLDEILRRENELALALEDHEEAQRKAFEPVEVRSERVAGDTTGLRRQRVAELRVGLDRELRQAELAVEQAESALRAAWRDVFAFAHPESAPSPPFGLERWR